ncbi:MAG: hypothetical protein RIE22_10085 [Alphaproteobacteria bacterium]
MLDFQNRRQGHVVSKIPPKVPKVREFAEITMQDGVSMAGYVFVEATLRIQDLLNGPNHFFPFISETGEIQLINKAHVIRVRPAD